MEIIDNEILERELSSNYSIHEVFEYQRVSTLDGVIKRIKDSDKNEILLQMNINNVIPFYKLKSALNNDSEEEDKFWNHLVSLLFMSQLVENYDIELIHDIEEEKKMMTREPFDNYHKFKDTLLDRNDVIEAIRNLKLENARIHIVLRAFNNESVWKELVNYLGDKIPFITMIYSDGNMPVWNIDLEDDKDVTDTYKYKCFDGSEEGIGSVKLLTDKQYKKVLKNEAKIQKDIC